MALAFGRGSLLADEPSNCANAGKIIVAHITAGLAPSLTMLVYLAEVQAPATHAVTIVRQGLQPHT
jgi:hypothetical protein